MDTLGREGGSQEEPDFRVASQISKNSNRLRDWLRAMDVLRADLGGVAA